MQGLWVKEMVTVKILTVKILDYLSKEHKIMSKCEAVLDNGKAL